MLWAPLKQHHRNHVKLKFCMRNVEEMVKIPIHMHSFKSPLLRKKPIKRRRVINKEGRRPLNILPVQQLDECSTAAKE